MSRPPRSFWRREAREAIDYACAVGRDLGLEGKELEQYVRQTTSPGLSQGHWPLKMWRKEVRVAFPRAKKLPEDLPGDRPLLRLLEGGEG